MRSKHGWDNNHKDKEFGANPLDKNGLGISERTYWFIGILKPVQGSGVNLKTPEYGGWEGAQGTRKLLS